MRFFPLAVAFAFVIVLADFVPAEAKLVLTPQTVVDLALKQGLQARAAELQAQRGYLVLQQALGVLDFSVTVNPGFTYDRAPTIAGTNNVLTRTLNYDVILTKKIRTGTTVGVEFIKTQDATIFNAGSSTGAGRLPNENLVSTQLTLRQELWRDMFGYADRLGIELGKETITSALETREDQLQTVLLDAMTLFWNTYTSEQQLQEDVFAREKYEALVRNVRRKAGFSLSTPGELPRLEAELLAADERVKTESQAYLASVDKLLAALQIQTKEEVAIQVPNDLPPIPNLPPKNIDELRSIKIAKIKAENAERSLRVLRSRGWPQLDLVARGRSTGVDEQESRASAQMTGVNYPTYYVGIEFSTALDSDLLRGQLADAQVTYAQAQNDLLIQRDTTLNNVRELERKVVSQYAVAKTTADIVDLRGRVVQQLETAYRQGRQPLVELIRAYNDLFAAQLDRAKSVGDYHIVLNQLAASRDELVSNVQ